ncbi:MAG TPA: acyl-CoA dehydrogenase family protein, partial [Gemmatimonadaceae bacterium]|nr:acyl-CoA dehydrogenase family protein [Gemmatimonadaceae bacterium]
MAEQLPSFTRGIYTGGIHDSLLFPYPPPLERRNPREGELVRTLIRHIHDLKETVIDSERIDEDEAIPEAVIRRSAEIGLLALTIPTEYGGLALPATGYAHVFGEISVADASLAVLVGVHCGLGAKAIVLFGTPEQKERYLPALARGEMLAAYALTEPETGSDAQNIRTRAELSRDGEHWVLNGRKIWIGNGARAGVIATFAQTPVERRGQLTMRPTAFLVRPDMPGFQVEGTVRKLGIRGSSQAQLCYDNLLVPRDHILGVVGKGFGVAVHVLNGGRMTLSAGCTAGSKRLLREMTVYAEHRVQFGRPLAAFEITQRKLAELASDIYAADAMLGVLSWLADSPDSDYSLEAACCKVFASELLWRAADEMVQVAGGRGYVKPYPYERMLRDARINRIFEGANEVLRLFIALNGVQGPAQRLKEVALALRNPVRSLGLLSGYAASRVRSALGATDTLDAELHPKLAAHKRYFEKHVGELAASTERMVMKYREQLLERQMVLERLADMGIEMFATASVIARTQRLIEERGVDGATRELSLCDLFCVGSGRRFKA